MERKDIEFKERVKKIPLKKVVLSIATVAAVGAGYYIYKKYFGKSAEVVEAAKAVVNTASDM